MIKEGKTIRISNLGTFLLSWLMMWGLSYVAVAVISPNVDLGTPNWAYATIGILQILCVVGYSFDRTRKLTRVGFFIFAIVETVGGVASWCGVSMWNVPFADKALFQISMAFADLLAAAMMFWLAFTVIKTSPEKTDNQTKT
jgi:hypothetical protein